MRRRQRLPRGFLEVAGRVEAAKERLLAAVPGPRRPPASLADSLMDFDGEVTEARVALERWRSEAPPDVWQPCRDALEESARRSEGLRMEAPPLDFESLVLVLGDVIAPLEAFAEAERALRRGDG